jgi:hypothetical protein
MSGAAGCPVTVVSVDSAHLPGDVSVRWATIGDQIGNQPNPDDLAGPAITRFSDVGRSTPLLKVTNSVP